MVELISPWMIMSVLAQSQPAQTKFQNLSERAATARDAGDTNGAIDFYREALDLQPHWQEGWWYLGSLYYDHNQYRKAVNALHRLTELNPSLGGAWALLGLSEFETHDYQQSLLHLQRARALGYRNQHELADVADYHLAILLNQRGQCDGARSLLSTLLLRGKNSEDVQVALGLSLLRVPLLPKQLDPAKDALVHRAGEVAGFMARRRYDEADDGFQRLLKQYPRTPFIHYAYGAMLASRGQDKAAEVQFRQETQITPDSGLAYTEWAFLEFRNQHYANALPLAQAAVKLAPGFFMARYILGNVFLARGETAASVAELEAACRLAPESPEIRYSLSRAYARAGKPVLARREHVEFLRLRSRKDATLRERERQTESPNVDAGQAKAGGSPSTKENQ